MRRGAPGLAALLLPGLATAQNAPPPAGLPASVPEAAETLVVTGRRPPRRRPLPPAVLWFDRLCIAPDRAGRPGLRPPAASAWRAVDDAERAAFDLSVDADAAVLPGPGGGVELVAVHDRVRVADGLTEVRCAVVAPGDAGEGVAQAMAGLLGAPGTQRHVGIAEGVPRVGGWERRLWTAMPPRDGRGWRVPRARPGTPAGGTFLVVFDPAFYATYDRIAVEANMLAGPSPSVVLRLVRTTRTGGAQPR